MDMPPYFECSTCGSHWFTGVAKGRPCPACRAPLGDAVQARVSSVPADAGSREDTFGGLELDQLDQPAQTRVQLLVAEMLARLANPDEEPRVSWVRAVTTPRQVRVEAAGLALGAPGPDAGADSGAEWPEFITEQVADRWGVDELKGAQLLWFEVDRVAG